MDAMIAEFECNQCNLFRSLETTKQSINRRLPSATNLHALIGHEMLYSVHINVGFHQPLEKFN